MSPAVERPRDFTVRVGRGWTWRELAGSILFALPWLNPFTPGPSPAVWPWLFSAACGCLLIALAGWQPSANWRKLAAASAVVVAWAVLSQPGTPDGVTALAAGLLLICVAAAAATLESVGQALRAGILLAAALSAVIGLMQYLGVSETFGPWMNYARVGEAYGNLRQPNQFATLCWLGMAVLLWGGLRLPRGWVPIATILLASASASSVSRTGMLQGLLLFALCVLWPGSDRRRSLMLCAIAALAYLAATVILPVLLEATTGALPSRLLWSRLSGSYGCNSRAVLWSNVATLIAQRPLTGWGWGELDFAHFTTLYSGPRFCEILDNAHNLPLHLAVELGAPAAVLLCAGALAWGCMQRPWRELDPQRKLAWALIGLILLHNMLEYPLWYGPFQIAFGAGLGVLLRPGASHRPVPQPRHAIAGCTVAALLIGACAYATWDYWRVSQVYLPSEQRRDIWRADPLNEARRSRLFAAQAAFAELTLSTVTRSNAESIAALAHEMLHYSPEPRVVELLIEADTLLGNESEAVLMLARFSAAYPDDYKRWRTSRATASQGAPGTQD